MLLFSWARVAIGQDFDGDGVADAADTCPSVANPTQTAVLGEPIVLPGPARTSVAELVAGDVDGDGDADLVGSVSPAGVAVWLRGPTGWTVLDPSVDRGVSDAPSLVDLDGDGVLDLLTGEDAGWSRGDGAGGFTFAASFHWGWFDDESAVPLDADGDGDPDIVYAGTHWEFYGSSAWSTIDAGVVWNEGGALVDGGPATLSFDPDAVALIAGDIDGDGDDDYFRRGVSYGSLWWHDNDGTGQFAAWDTGVTLVADLAAADLDGDGDTDAAIVTTDGRGVALESLAGASFVEHELGPASAGDEVAIGDLDRDGVLDLAAAGTGGTVWWRGLGAFGFDAAAIASAEPGHALAVADADRSGTTDLVFVPDGVVTPWVVPNLAPADHDAVPPCDVDDDCPLDPRAPCVDTDGDGLSDDDEVRIDTDPTEPDTDGDGLGDLDEQVGATDPTVADTDGDGLLDGSDACPNDVRPGGDGWCCDDPEDTPDDDGDGVVDPCDGCPGVYDPHQGLGWDPPAALATSGALALADLDDDVDLDAFVSSTAGLTLLESDGGGFGAPVALGRGGEVVAVGDLDADGRLDLAFLGDDPPEVVWRQGRGGANFGPEVPLGTPLSSAYTQILAADVTGGPGAEVLVLDDYELIVYEPLSGATTTRLLPDSTSWHGLSAGDVDGDGATDLAFAASGLYVLGHGAAAPVAVPDSAGARDVEVVDVDGDGDADLLAIVAVPGTGVDELRWYEQDGAAWGSHVVTSLGGTLFALGAADLDGDADADVVLGQGVYELAVLLGDGAGGFAAPALIERGTVTWLDVGAADVDLDGVVDLVASGFGAPAWFPGVSTPDADRDGVCDPFDPDFDPDPDGDGLDLAGEAQAGTDPADADTDGDGVSDGVDDCPRDADPAQLDQDGDGRADACDFCPADAPDDTDLDGVCDADDVCPGTDDALGCPTPTPTTPPTTTTTTTTPTPPTTAPTPPTTTRPTDRVDREGCGCTTGPGGGGLVGLAGAAALRRRRRGADPNRAVRLRPTVP